MKGLLYIVIFTLLLSSCVEEDSPLEYMQFSSYELGFLYYPYDTLTYLGNNIECHDTVLFLINKKDTINANVITTFFHWQEPLAFSLKYPVRGTSKLYFEETCGISYLSFSITKKYGESVGYIYSDLKINNRYYEFQNDRLDTIKPVPLFVQGFEYDSVYIFNIHDAGSAGDFLQINYARKYGFISIKVNDSIRIERLDR